MFPFYDTKQKTKKRKCIIYKKTDGSDKELNLKVHRQFILFRFFNNQIPESFSPLVPAIFSNKEMREVYKCVLYSYLSYKDRSIIDFPPEIKIEFEKFDSDVGKIPFFIVYDSTINAIVVSCRGSSCMDDFITDSLGNGVTYNGGKFHEGVFSTASYIFLTCQTKLIELNEIYNSKSYEEFETSYTYDQYDYYYSDYYSEEESYYEEEDENDNNDQYLIKKPFSHQMSQHHHQIHFCHKSTSEPNFHSYHNSNPNPINDSCSSENLNAKRRSSSSNDLLQHRKISNGNMSENSDNKETQPDEKQHKNHHRSSSLKNESSNLKLKDEKKLDSKHEKKSGERSHSNEIINNDNDDSLELEHHKYHMHHKSMPDIKSKDENSDHDDSKEKSKKNHRSSSLANDVKHHDDDIDSKGKEHKNRRLSSLTHESSHHHHHKSLSNLNDSDENSNQHLHHKSLSNLNESDKNSHSHHELKSPEKLNVNSKEKEKEKSKKNWRSSSLENDKFHHHNDEINLKEEEHKHRRSSSLTPENSHHETQYNNNHDSEYNAHKLHLSSALKNEKQSTDKLESNEPSHKEKRMSLLAHEKSHPYESKHHNHPKSSSSLKLVDEITDSDHKIVSHDKSKKDHKKLSSNSSSGRLSLNESVENRKSKEEKHPHFKSMPEIKPKDDNLLSDSQHKSKSAEKLNENSNQEDSKEKEKSKKNRRSSSLETGIQHHNDEIYSKLGEHKSRRSSSLTNENSQPHQRHKSLSNLNESEENSHSHHHHHHHKSLSNLNESEENSHSHSHHHHHYHHKSLSNLSKSDENSHSHHLKAKSSPKFHKNHRSLSLENKNSLSSDNSESNHSNSSDNPHKERRKSSMSHDHSHTHYKSEPNLKEAEESSHSHHLIKLNEKLHKNHRSSSLTKENSHNESSDSDERPLKKRRSSSLSNLNLHSARSSNMNDEHHTNRKFTSSEELFTESEFSSTCANRKKIKIIITGHSLGAAVAGVVAYLFREKFPELDVHAICFAPPPTLTFNLWKTTGTYIKSFMIEGDIVPFLSVLNIIKMSDIMFPTEHTNKAFKNFVKSYLEKQSIEEYQEDFSANETLYPPGQMYLIRFTDEEKGIFSKKKRKKNDVKTDQIQLCQILNPDYFSNFVKNIQEFNHVVKNYMRLIIRLMNKFKKLNHQASNLID